MYLVLDVESIRDDAAVVASCRSIESWSDDGEPVYESDEACMNRVEKEICQDGDPNDCWWPLRYQRPVLVSMIAVDPGLNYITHRTVFGDDPRKLAVDFWSLLNQAPQALNIQHVVTFNGKGFDMPLMEIQAMRHEIICPWWFAHFSAKPWENPRNGTAHNKIHLDVFNELATRGTVGGNLDYWSKVFGLPGKVDTKGTFVDDLHRAGDWDAIQDYCLCDCLNTLGCLMGLLRMGDANAPGPRGPVFERTLTSIMEARKAEGTTSKELERYWKLYGPEIPF